MELIHISTLVHDDVLDEADLRRNTPTINALQGNEAAVILGDWLIASSFRLIASLGRPEFDLALGEATRRVCGEIHQLVKRGDDGLTVEEYLDIVSEKLGHSWWRVCPTWGKSWNNDTRCCKVWEISPTIWELLFRFEMTS